VQGVYGLRFGATLSLPCPMGVTALSQLIEMITTSRNEARTSRFSKRRTPLTFIDIPNPLNHELQWVGVTAPYMQGMLLLHEPNSSEYGLSTEKFYTEVSLTYFGTGKPVGKLLPQEDELKLVEDLRILSRILYDAPKAAKLTDKATPANAA
jgi:hypothetical protein